HRALLFIDGDLEDSAVGTAPLTDPVLAGQADMTIAILPAQKRRGGGFGFVVGLAKKGIAELSGFEATQPLEGMRSLTREASGAGRRVTEVECDLHHRVAGRDLRAQLHRAAQYRDVARALLVRRLRAKRSGAAGPGPQRSGTAGPQSERTDHDRKEGGK